MKLCEVYPGLQFDNVSLNLSVRSPKSWKMADKEYSFLVSFIFMYRQFVEYISRIFFLRKINAWKKLIAPFNPFDLREFI